MENHSSGSSVKRSAELPVCKYGKDCYRKNRMHFEEYQHPNEGVKHEKKQKFCEEKENIPVNDNFYGFYLTTVAGIAKLYNAKHMAISLQDILADNADNFVASVQFNFMFDIPWLRSNYPEPIRNKPLLLVHGFSGIDQKNLEADAMKHDNIDVVKAKLPIPYGTHHSKMMFLQYTNGMRVVIHTANLIQQDWYQKTQGVWRSRLFPKITNEYKEEKDQFKSDLKKYLSCYNSKKLEKWIQSISQYDMSVARVQLIASVPGRHTGLSMSHWGHLKVRHVLKRFGPLKSLTSNAWKVVGQFSSIGSLGDEANKWLTGEWIESLSTCRDGAGKFDLKLIYPTMENVRKSLEGYSAGGSLPYSVKTAMKQRYLKKYMCQWISNNRGRSLASPHIKSYACISSDDNQGAWFLLTSANLSKAAWGVFEKNQSQLMIRSYEIGVMFLPKAGGLFLDCTRNVNFGEASDTEGFNLPYDTPLTPYTSTDKPWVWDIHYTKEDSHGRLWVPT